MRERTMRAYILTAALSALLAGGLYGSYRLGEGAGRAEVRAEFERYKADQSKALAEAYTKAKKAEQELKNKARELERLAAESQASARDSDNIVFREVIKYVESPNDNDCVVDDDWVRIYNTSIR